MITGDHALTAIHVAKELTMMNDSCVCLEMNDADELELKYWDDSKSDYATQVVKVEVPTALISKVIDVSASLTGKQHLVNNMYCLTGSAFEVLVKANHDAFTKLLLPIVSVFARFSPSNKVSFANLWEDFCDHDGFA